LDFELVHEGRDDDGEVGRGLPEAVLVMLEAAAESVEYGFA
jgi:hypothetical protein